jgi:hypothetical protein
VAALQRLCGERLPATARRWRRNTCLSRSERQAGPMSAKLALIRHSGGGEISASFADIGPACRSDLERHVFLRHRRAVAGSRSPQSR